ncbi:MAG: hypothetical protein EOO63_05300, partial [Hymenobacter sp.]
MPPLATPTANTAFTGLISVVAPLYNEADTVAQLVSRVTAVMQQHNYDYELILVNDGAFHLIDIKRFPFRNGMAGCRHISNAGGMKNRKLRCGPHLAR